MVYPARKIEIDPCLVPKLMVIDRRYKPVRCELNLSKDQCEHCPYAMLTPQVLEYERDIGHLCGHPQLSA
jgi:hypothetical protein